MIFSECKIDWVNVLRDWSSGIYYSKRDWLRLAVSDIENWQQGSHGRTVSPTYAEKRIITLEWWLDGSDNESLEDAIAHLRDIFSLQSNPSEIDPKLMYIKDNEDNEWRMQIKVKSPLEFEEYDENSTGIAYKRRVVLEDVGDPVYRSYDEILTTWEDWLSGQFSVPFDVTLNFDEYTNIIDLSQSGNVASPIRWELTVLNDFTWPLIIVDITNWLSMSLDIDWTAGDLIIIDWENYTITQNWVNIKSSREPWSTWHSIKWDAQFAVVDSNWYIPTNDLDVNVYFRNSLL